MTSGTFMTPLTVLSVEQLKPGLHSLSLLIIHSTKTLSFSSIKNRTYQLHLYSRRQIPVLNKMKRAIT